MYKWTGLIFGNFNLKQRLAFENNYEIAGHINKILQKLFEKAMIRNFILTLVSDHNICFPIEIKKKRAKNYQNITLPAEFYHL